MSSQDRIRANWMSTAPNDMRGVPFRVGDRFVKATKCGQAVSIQICTVTRLENGKVYANGSHTKINFPGRCLIVNDLFPENMEA